MCRIVTIPTGNAGSDRGRPGGPVARGGATRLHLEPLPAYAPELNLDEWLWRYLKHVELRNVCCHSLTELGHELRLAVARVRHRLTVIQGWVRHCGYSR